MVISVAVRSRDPEQDEMSWHVGSRDTESFRLSTPQHLNMFGLKFNFSIQVQEESNVMKPNLNKNSLRGILHHSNAVAETEKREEQTERGEIQGKV